MLGGFHVWWNKRQVSGSHLGFQRERQQKQGEILSHSFYDICCSKEFHYLFPFSCAVKNQLENSSIKYLLKVAVICVRDFMY